MANEINVYITNSNFHVNSNFVRYTSDIQLASLIYNIKQNFFMDRKIILSGQIVK